MLKSGPDERLVVGVPSFAFPTLKAEIIWSKASKTSLVVGSPSQQFPLIVVSSSTSGTSATKNPPTAKKNPCRSHIWRYSFLVGLTFMYALIFERSAAVVDNPALEV